MKYQVWSQGNKEALVGLLGECESETFQEACDKILVNSPTYDSKNLTDWGLYLFDNEEDARKSSGVWG